VESIYKKVINYTLICFDLMEDKTIFFYFSRC